MTLLRKQNRRKTPPKARLALPEVDWQRLAQVAIGVAAIALLAGLLRAGLDQPIHRVRIEGSFQRVTAVEVEQAVRGSISGGLMTVDLAQLRDAVEGLAWVDRARIMRRWPDEIVIEVVEQIPAARWGEDGLLNTRGELFMTGSRHLPPELPELEGPAGSETIVAQRYLAVESRLLDQGLRLAALRLDARGAWELRLTNGVTVRLGRSQVDERMDRFIRVAAQVIAGRAADIEHVDMRYSSGFSIGWRRGAGPDSGRATAGNLPEGPELNG